MSTYSESESRLKNKVYINPNFNRTNVTNDKSLHNGSVMHVNPKFSHLVSGVQHNTCNKNKIYINPNFIKPKTGTQHNSIFSNSVREEDTGKKLGVDNISMPISYVAQDNPQPSLPLSLTKSKYSLVRQNITNAGHSSTKQSKNTYKISKYKSVPLNDIKKNIEALKVKDSPKNTVKCVVKSQSLDSCRLKVGNTVNQFKLINYRNILKNSVLPVRDNTLKARLQQVAKSEVSIIKKEFRSYQSQNRFSKIKKGHLKKNNIPCPLFRKFGKCLRNIRGKCQYLHDKKHVSVCRKFIKGVCHDKECLLSHDLIKQKMPTCYFYLQGACLKEDCPYLHVKLNANVKICPDFLKGYCEKGSKCLYRHIDLQMRKNESHAIKFKNDIKNISSDKVNVDKVCNFAENQNTTTALESSANVTEYRYYQDIKENLGTNEIAYKVIKPTRCKLGTLPSFIQL